MRDAIELTDDGIPGSWVSVKVEGEWLLDKNGNRRRFKTSEAALKAARKHLKTPNTRSAP